MRDVSDAEPLNREVLESQKVDVILVDYSMPGMSGVEFLEAARQHLSDVLVIMITGYTELPNVVDARKSGLVTHILAKPWMPQQVVEAVRNGISLKRMRDAVDKLR